MAKQTAKNGILLIGGYNFSTYAMSYEITDGVDVVEVTGLSDGSHNYIPGQRIGRISANLLWDADSGKVHTALASLPSPQVTLIPEGYVLGNASLSMPTMQSNYTPSGSPSTAISVGNIVFESKGDNAGIEHGYALAHGTITNTTTGTGFADISGGAVTAKCAGTIHVWSATSTDTYEVKIQHSTSLGSGYSDLITFTIDGTSITSERVAVASGTVNQYRRVVATRTGSAGDSFGFSVHFAHYQ